MNSTVIALQETIYTAQGLGKEAALKYYFESLSFLVVAIMILAFAVMLLDFDKKTCKNSQMIFVVGMVICLVLKIYLI